MRRALIRLLVVLTLSLGVNYVVWRWLDSIEWSAWWLAVPLIVAETYSLLDAFLFGLTMWRIRERGAAPPPPEGVTVDVFITTYNEPIDLVMTTARAAVAIRTARGSSTTARATTCAARPRRPGSATSRAARTGPTGRGTRRPATSTTRCSPRRASSC